MSSLNLLRNSSQSRTLTPFGSLGNPFIYSPMQYSSTRSRRNDRSRRSSRPSRLSTVNNLDLSISTHRFPYVNELYLPFTKKNSFLNNFVRKYIMVKETLEIQNLIIRYAETSHYNIDDNVLNHVPVFYDNYYLNPYKEKFEERLLTLEDNDTRQTLNLYSYIYVLSDDCIHCFNHLETDEQLSKWMRIKSQLPTIVTSPINRKCSLLIKEKLETITGHRFRMNRGDYQSIYIDTPPEYIFGPSTSKMHICFNSELLSNTKLYFEAILIFHNFYMEHMRHVSYYKVLGANIERDSKKQNIMDFNNFNRKLADIAIYLQYVPNEIDIIDYGERFRLFFMKSWKHKIVPFSNSKLLFNNPINDTLKKGKYFVQFTSGASGDTKLDCITKINNLPVGTEYDGALLPPQSICRGNYKIKTGISFKKDGLKYRVDCKHSRKATKKECKKGIRNESIGRFVDSKFVTDSQGINKHVCLDELCFY
jgi:hypothetical protein